MQLRQFDDVQIVVLLWQILVDVKIKLLIQVVQLFELTQVAQP